MDSSFGIQRSGSATNSPLNRQESQTSERSGKANLGGADRKVAQTHPDASTRTTFEQTSSPTPKGTLLAERSVSDVTNDKPGRLRQAFSWLKSKAQGKGAQLKDYGAGKYEASKELGKKMVRGGVAFAQSPLTTTGNALVRGAVYAHGKYQAASSKTSAAFSSAKQGVSQLKADPKGTLAAGKSRLSQGVKAVAKGIKQRAVTIPTLIKNKMPAPLSRISLPSIKSIATRSAQPVPPSASVKAALDVASDIKAKQDSKLSKADEKLETARAERANLKTLNKLANNPSDFYTSDKEITVNWGGETLSIQGKGLSIERVRTVSKAVNLALANWGEIRKELQVAGEQVSELKADRKQLKSDNKEQLNATRKQIAGYTKESYQQKLALLNKDRAELKSQIASAKATLAKAGHGETGEVTELKNSLKTRIEADTQQAKFLTDERKAATKQEKQVLKALEKQLKNSQANRSKFQGQLQTATGSQKIAAEAGLRAAHQEVNSLTDELTHQKERAQLRIAGLESRISALEGQVASNKAVLADIDGSVSGGSDQKLYQDLERAKQELEHNSQVIQDLKHQYQADKKAIKQLK